MSAERDLEIRGQTVEEAVEKGLARLGLMRSDVIVDVIDEGSRGILGLGAREAVVRLVPMVRTAAPPAPRAPSPTPPPAKPKAAPLKVEAGAEQTAGAAAPVADVPISPEELEKERDMALEIIQMMLEKMQVEAQVTADLTEPDDLTGQQVNLIQVNGRDLGVLIGPRGETMNSLQYVARLLVSHQMQQRADFIIDIEGYRERRKQALARLAERMADKVMKQGRPVSLEPMPPNERRVIHVTLRDYDGVYTQSTGEGDRRRVQILPQE
jgi:spoIIIJ-associated protein